MADKISPLDRAKAAIDLIKRRVDLSHKFAEFNELRQARVAAGDPPWRVLRYQRIIDPSEVGYPLPKLKLVRPKLFEKHMYHLATTCRVVPLESLLDDIQNDQAIPDKTVALTFDCGWLDQFVYAVPILKKYNLPATFFLSTAFVGTNNYFWQDKVMFALLMMKDAGMKFIPFEFLSEEEVKALQTISPDGEINLDYISAVTFIIEWLEPKEKLVALTILGELAEHLGGVIPGEPVFMSWDEAKLLNSANFSIGSLGHRHVPFAAMTEDECTRDTVSSFALLEQIGLQGSRLLALPDDYLTPESGKILSTLKTFDFAFAIQPPGTADQIVKLEDKSVILRTTINEQAMATVESLASELWL